MIHDEVSRANARRERREARSTRRRRPARVRATLPHGLRRLTSRPESREICRNALRDRGSPGRVVPFGADVGRKPVVEPGPDAGVRISSAKTPRLGPTVRDAGRGRVGHRSLRDVRGTEHGFDDGHGGAALDAMRARILGMQRRVVGCQVASRSSPGCRRGRRCGSRLRDEHSIVARHGILVSKATGSCRRARALRNSWKPQISARFAV